MTETENFLKTFEWYDIEPGQQFFDQLEKRFFINVTKRPLKLGFGHNSRRVEMIAIGDGVEKDPAIEALEGEEIRE